ncbi:MAG: hypothetical protein JWO62_384 [Acidimicrobiaceae bacterium]|nr:hypothetical protein [Acidimicrobiaceae bacterium]
MEHARLTLMTADPASVDSLVRYLEGDVRPRVEKTLGNEGMVLFANPELGVIVVESFWVSGDAMRESEHVVAPLRDKSVGQGAATVSVEHHEVASSLRLERPKAGAGARLTRMDLQPPRVEETIAAYEDSALPWLGEMKGFSSALFLVHRPSGRAMIEMIWHDEASLAASRGAEASVRADVVAATDGVVRALEEFGLVFTSGRY